MKKHTAGISAGVVALPCLAVLALYLLRPSPPTAALTNTIYVWNRAWSGAVCDAADCAAKTGDLWLLCGECTVAHGALAAQAVRPAWEELESGGGPVTLVVRADVSLAQFLAEDRGHAQSAADFFAEFVAQQRVAAECAGVDVAGVQMDYDCPTARLDDYAALAKALAGKVTPAKFSITALPDWLRSPDFRKVARRCDYFVLQLHGLERPSAPEDRSFLFDPARALDYVGRAARVRVPFYAALPTYGYDVVFDEEGAFAGLAAETVAPVWPVSMGVRTVVADPGAVAGVVSRLRADRPDWLLGVAWFRMPVEGDRLNWDWRTLATVMEGRAPEAGYAAELRSPQEGLYELWLRNAGGYAAPGSVEVHLALPESPVARDCINGFREERLEARGAVRLSGPAPRGREAHLIAWYRMDKAPELGEVRLAGDE